MRELLEKLLYLGENVEESTIDFPRPGLDVSVWDKIGDSYVIKPDVKKIILDTLDKYIKINLRSIADSIHITGSIGTNQYVGSGPDASDLDVHLVIDIEKLRKILKGS